MANGMPLISLLYISVGESFARIAVSSVMKTVALIIAWFV